ncbi:MAG TPA: glycoside hydrolase family 27 protein [Bacteroidota bacterium]|nr:glycoside hydrolase family 27 protein [Bacteroidota bacterium]
MPKRRLIMGFFCLALVFSLGKAQKFEGLALTPPMGWNSWNTFACNVDENLIKEITEAMIASGMKDAGYQYIVIDDCWQGERDSLGFIHPDPQRFPSGMKALADFIHSRGLKFGIYSCAGNKTCGGREASRGYEYQDAFTYAQWGVDYLKYDWCNTSGLNSVGAYTTMRDALYAAGRPIVFSICEWGDTKPWEWAKDVGHLWRTTGDIIDCFDCEVNHGSWSSWGVMKIVNMRAGIRQYAGPDHWNDPDMLEVGRGMSTSEDRAHFTMWCMMAAPLIAGNDLRSMTKETVEILTNKEVIAIDQDSLGVQGFRYNDNFQGVEVWGKPLKNGDWAICFLNRSEVKRKVHFDWSHQNIADDISHTSLNTQESEFTVRDLWGKKNIGTTRKPLDVEVGSHDVVLLRLIKNQK